MKYILFCLTLCLSVNCFAQTEIVRYYNEPYEGKEKAKERAKYAEYIRKGIDETITIEWKNLKHDIVVQSESYKEGTPVGLWFYANDKGELKSSIDYGFETKYEPVPCVYKFMYSLGDDTVRDLSAGKFEPPILAMGETLHKIISRIIIYPKPCLEDGTDGLIYINGILTKEGVLQDLFIFETPSKILAAEAMRVVRAIKYETPAKLNGEPIDLCIQAKITFKLD